MIILITGGIKSGKSNFALELTESLRQSIRQRKKAYFLATAVPMDREIQERIKIHQKNRGSSWETIEEPLNIIEAFDSIPDKSVLLLDCLTLWIANLIHEKTSEKILFTDIEKRIKDVLVLIKKKKLKAVFVTNEVGSGIIPENKLSRFYGDALGKLNQIIAGSADEVYMMVCGISMKIKAGEKK